MMHPPQHRDDLILRDIEAPRDGHYLCVRHAGYLRGLLINRGYVTYEVQPLHRNICTGVSRDYYQSIHRVTDVLQKYTILLV